MTGLKRYSIDSKGLAFFDEEGTFVALTDVDDLVKSRIAAAMHDVMHPIVYERFICESISKGDNGEVAKMAGVIVVVLDRITKAQYAAIESMKGPNP